MNARARKAAPTRQSRKSAISGITPSAASKLAQLGVARELDLVLHLPLRYEDETRITPIAAASCGQAVQIEGTVEKVDIVFRPRRQLVVRMRDASSEAVLRFFNFYASQQKALEAARKSGSKLRAFGELRPGFFGGEMIHPRYRVLRGEEPLPAALTPVYPTTAGLAQPVLRKLIEGVLSRAELEDTLPESLRMRYGLLDFKAAVLALHRPATGESQALSARTHPAWIRVKFDELLAQQLSMRKHYTERKSRRAAPLAQGGQAASRLIERLPFHLTPAQQRVWREIESDLAQSHPMHRLLQGDVGSGKTVVAALAAVRAAEHGFQTAIMAPTEILAEQHYRKFSEWLVPLGLCIAWLTGSQTRKERDAAGAALSSGEAAVAVGTHALFQEGVAFHSLGLAIVDEQHRFGVAQRLALRGKAARSPAAARQTIPEPHLLMMSATPIPRTLSMSYYADLDVSIIDELPPGRRPVLTKLVAFGRRAEVLSRVRQACSAGQQAYWVCPLVEESETLDLQNAIDTHAALAQEFAELSVGLVHGRLGPAEKADVMRRFSSGKIQLLVSTTVIEVGVDVPNACLMVVEHAERLGLAQLHQLRGRVGRGAAESVCVLLYAGPLSEAARRRLKVIYENADGFAIAREDLLLRGPGEMLGARQSGVPLLRFADLALDEELLDQAREAAAAWLESDPAAAQRHMDRWLGSRAAFLMA
jgi:ATP-dependent DNA helicase RecG